MVAKPFRFSLRGEILTLVVCVVLSFVLLLLPGDSRVVVADRLGLVLTAPYWTVRNFGADVFATQKENAWLKKRVAELELMASSVQRMQRDADRLAGPAMDPGFDGELVPCRVVMRQRSRFANMIKISSLEPVAWQPWQPVISGSGYLGRVRTVISDTEAWVELLTAPEFAVGVEIERTGLLGVLRPRADRFTVQMVGRDEDVQVGDRVITSGIAEIREGVDDPGGTGLTPRGFPVGLIVAVASPSEQIFKEIMVEPAASFKYNETVFVVTPLGSQYRPAPGGGG
jgi:cell shape-determining protein MreC